jgi:hypothetical protein
MRRVVTTVTGTGNSPVIPMDHRAQFFNVGIEAVVSATATYNVQFTLDDIYNSAITPTWFNVPSPFTGATANQAGNLTIPCSAMRLNVTASTGSVTLTLLQSSGQG